MAKLALIILVNSLALVFGQNCGVPTVAMRANRNLEDIDGQRIVGGVEARPGSHPWIVSLQQYGQHFCGGSLIRVGNKEESDIIVTAAHCAEPVQRLEGTRQLTVSAGAHNLNSPTNDQQTVYVTRVVGHEQYDADATLNDIAVFKLSKPIKFTPTVQPVCLPKAGSNVAAGTEAIVAGWGLTRENGPGVSSVLNQVGVPIISPTECAKSYGRMGVKIDGQAMLCGGYQQGGKDSCQGDSGGPFITKEGNSYVLQGVVSFGVGCARPGVPGVYSRVANYVGWLNQKITSLSGH